MQATTENRRKAVKVIPAAPPVPTLASEDKPIQIRRRVAAYARVSTDTDEQLFSFDKQVEYYTEYIKSNPQWEYVNVYTDEGITGTSLKHRDGFNQMVADALAGKIDLIITKSVSRFARNTVDALVAVRKLKDHGVEVFFENQNIYTMDGKGELLITIMSSLAQEEARSISENVAWGKRKSAADGKICLPYKHFLGFEKGEDGLPKVVEEEAKIIRRIYRMFLEGKSATFIANILTEEGIPTPWGKEKWTFSTIQSILTNEKYKGAAILQKTYIADFLSKKVVVNDGSKIPKYYIEQSHEAIIDPMEFDLVQLEIERRRKMGRQYKANNVFSSKIICGDCGNFYGRKIWHSRDKYRTAIWQCNCKFSNEVQCRTPHFKEEELKAKFMTAFWKLRKVRETTLEACGMALEAVSDLSDLEAAQAENAAQIDELVTLSRSMIEENARAALDQTEYNARWDALQTRYAAAVEKRETLSEKKHERLTNIMKLKGFMKAMQQTGKVILTFDENFFLSVTEHMTVFHDGRIEVTFKDGSRVEC